MCLKKNVLLIIGLVFGLMTIASSQNREDFFKSMPRITTETPDWAVLMYSDNPNVFEVDRLYANWFAKRPFEKTLHTQNYKHWKWRTAEWITASGYIHLPDPQTEADAYAALQEKSSRRTQQRQGVAPASSTSTEWCSFGPFETYKENTLKPISTHKNVYSIDQSQSNPDLLICGTEAGGVFKSTNRGQDWSLINKDEVFVGGNEAVKIHPSNPDVFLVASNRRIYRSTNAGTTWLEEHYMNGGGYEFQFHPQNQDTIFCAGQRGLFRSMDGGDNWTQVITDRCWDIKFHPTDPNTVYLLRENSGVPRAEFYRSIDGGINWTLQDLGWYTPSDPSNASAGGGKLAVTPAAPDMIYACLIGESKSGDEGWIGVYRSMNKGSNWVNPSGQDGSPYGVINGTAPWNVAAYSGGYHQGFFNFDLEVSDIDPGKIWIATIRLSESADSGKTFISIGAANSQRLSDQHADVQDLEVNGNDVWVASDGGINYSTDELTTHTSRKRGISASHFWGFNIGWNEDTYTGGRYHDGTIGWYEGYGPGNVHVFGGVEEPSGYVHPIESRKILFRTNYASTNTSVETMPEILGGNTIEHADMPLHPNESYGVSRSSGIYFDPRYANHVYMGKDSSIWKSTDGGVSFTAMRTFTGGNVYEMAISKADPDVIYAVYRPSSGGQNQIYKSTDGGFNWSATNNPPGNRNQIELTLNPADANEIWVGLGSASSGQKVYQSTNGGSSWNNKTSPSINSEDIQDILYQGGSNSVVYLATYNSVYYYDVNTNNWVDYGLGLPMIVKSLQIRPFYRDAELRLGSRGRGVWGRQMVDTVFAPIAQPITYDQQVYCSRDTVQFDCYSVLRHQGATWTWSFSPAPAYISSLTARNPKVVFGTSGNYSVTLGVTDANGGSDSKTIPDMITVQNLCEPDTVPGHMLSNSASGDYAQIPDLGLTSVDTLTISAWIKPDGIQPDYTGIVMSDGDAAGFNFASGNNSLHYHWPGGEWWWNSGLIVPPNQWSHVAMVATTTGMTVYVNGVSATHSINLDPVDISTMKIGSYHGWASRNFIGEIDEVAIWDRALSRDEIRELRHLTKEDLALTDSHLLAYYQFNEPITGSRVMDKVGSHHASTAGSAGLPVSTAPVGGGSSMRMSLLGTGNYDFLPAGLTAGLPGSGIYADGEVVVSRINLAPDSVPNAFENLSQYWIVNNYGINSTFSPLDVLTFAPTNGIPAAQIFDDPNEVILFTREANGYLNNWVEACRADTVLRTPTETMHFDNSCGIGSFTQYLITAADVSTSIPPSESSTTPSEVTIRVFPNPVHSKGTLQIDLLSDPAGKFSMFNSQGKWIKDAILTQGVTSVAMEDLPAGVYSWRITTAKQIRHGKIVIQ